MIIDKKKFTNFIILEKMNQPKLKLTFYYNFGYYNFGWELTTEIVINDRNCNKLFYSISDCHIATEMVFINPNYDHWQEKIHKFHHFGKDESTDIEINFYYNFGWQPTTEIVINFLIPFPIAKLQRKWYLSTQIMIIDKENSQLSSFWKRLFNRNWN